MPKPSEYQTKKEVPTMHPTKRALIPGITILSDMGDGQDEFTPAAAQSRVTPSTVVPSTVHEAEIVDQTITPEQAQVRAMVDAAMKGNPTLALMVRTKGPLTMERVNVALDQDTLKRWRDLSMTKNLSRSILLADVVMPWVKANADRAGLIYAREQVNSRRKVALKHQKLAQEGQAGEDLVSGSSPETLYYPVAILNSMKALWSASGMKKKAFIEACIFLYLEIHAPQK